MPDLPFDHPEPFAATLGVMLYPGADEREKAEGFAAHYLAGPLKEALAQGVAIDRQVFERVATSGGVILDDLDKRWDDGQAMGEVFKIVIALHGTDPNLTSWNNAYALVHDHAGRHQTRAGLTRLKDIKTRFVSVAHLWAAWQIRGGKLKARTEVGYDLFADFQSFIEEAEALRKWGQDWTPARDKAGPILPDDMWRVPKDWQPIARRHGWPDTGRVPRLTLSEEQIAGLKPAGRPGKTE